MFFPVMPEWNFAPYKLKSHLENVFPIVRFFKALQVCVLSILKINNLFLPYTY